MLALGAGFLSLEAGVFLETRKKRLELRDYVLLNNNKKSLFMFSNPFSIAVIVSLVLSIPLYILSADGFQLSLSNFPLVLLSCFIASLIAAFWSKQTSSAQFSGTSENLDRETGSVKWFNANKGFGFITRDNGEDIFVHFRSIRGDGHRVLRDGQRVEFEVTEGDKGLQAEDVAVAS